ncbi:cyclin-dependent kinase inhibitor 5-like [Ananas comosus]|uniref:Cyclin-dependent kinase inhibitor 5-like n=1 Tax=Ananas comosus TaxID=4615 RepID=A0A6P5GEU0_ANACO|nr:cyclin-dependent kinase inhibitor 5-like [Ananas comosus]
MVGVRTRAKTLAMAAAVEEKARSKRRRRKKKKKNPSEAAVELRISYLQLRSRRVVMKSPLPPPPLVKARSAPNSNMRCRPSLDLDTASCGGDREDEEPPQFGEFDPSTIRFRRSGGGRNETTISNIRINESTTRSAVEMVPSETEIEEFFMAAERAERSRFADKYNYDIINDAPLEGRYEWGFE